VYDDLDPATLASRVASNATGDAGRERTRTPESESER
jgi:hypothetical protein